MCFLDGANETRHHCLMSTLTEIETAADSLPPEQMQELLLHLVKRVRATRETLPEPRVFSRETMENWIAEDEADMQTFAGR